MKLKSYHSHNKMDQFSLNALRRKPKAIMGSGIGNQVSGKGDRTIKRVDRSYMTYEKITTDKAQRSIMDQQQEHFKRTEGNRGYGSLIRAEGQIRNSDRVAGTGVRMNALGGGGGAAGRSYDGRFSTAARDAIAGADIRESLLSKTEGRRGEQKLNVRRVQSNQDATYDASIFAPSDKFQRGDNLAPGTINNNYLSVSVKPTESYTQLGQFSTHSSFGTDTSATINNKHISYEATSGTDTRGTFDKYTPTQVSGIIDRITIEGASGKQFLPVYEKEHYSRALESKIKIEGKSGEQYLPKYEDKHDLKTLSSKVMAKDVVASRSTTQNNARVEPETYIRLTPNKPTVEVKTYDRNNIHQNTDTHRDDYKIKHRRPDLNGFSVGDKSYIPTF